MRLLRLLLRCLAALAFLGVLPALLVDTDSHGLCAPGLAPRL